MNVDEMASLMNAILRRSGSRVTDYVISEVELEAIAQIVSGHALGACRAVSYILNVLSQTSEKPAATFIQAFSGSKWRVRKQFVEYKPRFGLSVMETFNTSLERMQHHKEASMKLLELTAFLSNNSRSLYSRDFFRVERPWLEELRADLPDYEIFALGLEGQNEYLLELERVSLGVRTVVPGLLEIHPLWIECIQQRAEHSGRLRWLRQILTLCHASFLHDPQQYTRILNSFKQNAIEIADRFAISLRDLCGTDGMWNWFRSSISATDERHADSFAPSVRSNDMTVSTRASIGSDDDLDPPIVPSKSHEDAACPTEVTAHQSEVAEQTTQYKTRNGFSDQICLLHEQCKAAIKAITSSNPEKLSEEAFAKLTQMYLGLLKHLKDIEENEKLLCTNEDYRARCLEIYDMLIRMAPAFRSKNPMLADLLQKRKEEFTKISRRSSTSRPGK
ncbi:MAG: hypothetical protein Q9225_001924 [Loekoesia sp. 1 TL-2023]